MWQTLRQIARVGRISEPAPQSSSACSDGDAQPLQAELARLLGRALAVRVVDAGSCNGCELEINALGNPYYNLEGLGVHLVASPRHADLLLVSGPVSRNMEQALLRVHEAMPEPRLVLAVGDCARDGGVFGCSYACRGGLQGLLPVDVYVAGCPPAPRDLLAGMLRAVRARAT